jgi:hypothetical protein
MSLPKPESDWNLTPREIWARVDWQANDFAYWIGLANLKLADSQLEVARDMSKSNASLVAASQSLNRATWVYAGAALLQFLVLAMQVVLFLRK